MTLCLAWKSPTKVHFAADSRLTINTIKCDGNNKAKTANYVDIGIKVFSIPVKIYSSIDHNSNKQTLDYDHSIGLCFAGHTTNAYIVKESIYEVLQHLQHTNRSKFSMEGLADLIAKFYEHTSRKLGEVLFEDSIAEFFITGFCPRQRKIKTYKFYLDVSSHPITAKYKEILTDNNIEFLGSGAKTATELHQKNPDSYPLFYLRDVIKDDSIKSVGGGIQYGDVDMYLTNNFQVLGIEDYELDENKNITRKLLLRGTELYNNDIELSKSDFHIAYSFLTPFALEIDELLKKNYIKD